MTENSLTHTAKLGEVLLGGLVLLVLIDPLVEVGPEEVHLLGLLEQAGPVGLVEVFLLQLELDVLAGVAGLGGLLVDLGVELELHVVVPLQAVGVAGEGQAGGLDVKLQAGGGHVGDGDGQVDEVLLGVRAGRALRPEDCEGAPVSYSVRSAPCLCCLLAALHWARMRCEEGLAGWLAGRRQDPRRS